MTLSYVRSATIFLLLLRVALWVFGLENPEFATGLLVAGVATALAWMEHQQSGENLFHSSLGASIWMSVSVAAGFVALLESIL